MTAINDYLRLKLEKKEFWPSEDAVWCSMSAESMWGFDRTVTKKYGCKLMAYDPTYVKYILHYVLLLLLQQTKRCIVIY